MPSSHHSFCVLFNRLFLLFQCKEHSKQLKAHCHSRLHTSLPHSGCLTAHENALASCNTAKASLLRSRCLTAHKNPLTTVLLQAHCHSRLHASQQADEPAFLLHSSWLVLPGSCVGDIGRAGLDGGGVCIAGGAEGRAMAEKEAARWGEVGVGGAMEGELMLLATGGFMWRSVAATMVSLEMCDKLIVLYLCMLQFM